MYALTQLHFIAAALYIGMGLYTLLQDRSSGSNRLFFALSLCFSLWAFANGMAIAAPTEETAWQLFHRFAPFWFLFPALLLHFSLRLIYGRIPKRFYLLPLLYAPGLALYILSRGGTLFISAFPSSGIGRYIDYDTSSPYFYLNIAYYSLYVLITIFLYLRWHRRSRKIRERIQALIILITLLAGAFLSSFFGTLLPALGREGIPPVSPLCMLVWTLGMSIAVVKYRLMRLSPDIAAATILRHIRDFVVLCGEHEEIVHVNTKVTEELATSTNREEGRAVGELFSLPAEGSLSDFLGREEVKECRSMLLSRDGREIPIFLTIMRMRDEAGGQIGFVLVGHDLRTYRQLEKEKEEHRKTSEQLKRSEATFSKAFQSSPVGMAIVDTASSKIEQLNDSARYILSYEEAASCDLPSSDRLSFLSWASGEQEAQFRSHMERSGRVYGLKSELYRCDGSTVEVLVSADRININGQEKMLFCFSDLTRTNRLERELITMQKFESIGLLAGGIAHDFNNLLTAIMGNISLAKEYTAAENSAATESLDLALNACNHAAQLTGQLLTFSRNEGAPVSSASVNAAVNQSINLALSGTDIETAVDDSETQLQVRADRGELVQIFNNLLINAKQAMPNGGSISVTIRRYRHPEGARYAINVPVSLDEGEYARVAIRDTGTGIPRSRIPHLFDPYFTTKPSGSGLGLSIVYSLIKKYNGEVTVDSRRGEGSTFTIFLPLIRTETSAEHQESLSEHRFSGTVLLMDDEEAIRKVGHQMLTQLGLTVHTDPEGEALLERVLGMKERGEVVDAVILDLTVQKGMNGPDTALRVRKLLPGVPIILTTGYASHEVLEEYTSYGFNDCVMKPFTRQHLAELLARHLNTSAQR